MPNAKPLSREFLERIKKDFDLSQLVPIEEAAAIFFEKMAVEDKAKYQGETEEEKLNSYTETLRELAATSFGVLPLHYAAEILHIRLSTLQNATGPSRERYFPKALIFQKDPASLEERRTYGAKLVCIFHRDFVNWVKTRYFPRNREELRDCKLNELLKDENGNWLPESEWPVYTFTDDETGEKRAVVLTPCHEKPSRNSGLFCSGRGSYGKAHYVIYRQITGGFSQMGIAANEAIRRKPKSEKKGRPAAKRDRSVAARIERRKAARQPRRKVAYVPDGFVL